mmetsp:Transcript_90120/g.176450  ORF Transcript_90120/g.176450 Transcript_90120/m.176450 type:complete len:118 (-) Transcript_90120:109-462(-)
MIGRSFGLCKTFYRTHGPSYRAVASQQKFVLRCVSGDSRGTSSGAPSNDDKVKVASEVSSPTVAAKGEGDNEIDESLIQDEWLSMERRVKNRKLRPKGSGLEGRSAVRNSAWDAEVV